MIEKKVGEICSRQIFYCEGERTIREACKLMHKALVSSLIVKNSTDEIVGIVTERDIVKEISQNKDVDTQQIRNIMSSPVKGVESDKKLSEVIETMRKYKCRHLLVYKDNSPFGIITQTDITQAYLEYLKNYSRILEEEVEKRTEEIRKLSEFKDFLIGTAAHDLRNPLTVICGWIDILEEDLQDIGTIEVHEGLETIRRQSKNMLSLINELLDVSKIQSGKVNLEMKEVDISAVLISSIKNNIMMARKKNINIIQKFPSTLPRVYGDFQRLVNVIDNLLSNAIKYSYRGAIITVDVKVEKDFIIIIVEDTGQGIKKEELPKLFTEFSKTSNRPTEGEESVGLGLAIVKKIVEMHNGEVWAESVYGKGSKFFVKLPILKEGGYE